jgi:hypothetical protein
MTIRPWLSRTSERSASFRVSKVGDRVVGLLGILAIRRRRQIFLSEDVRAGVIVAT